MIPGSEAIIRKCVFVPLEAVLPIHAQTLAITFCQSIAILDQHTGHTCRGGSLQELTTSAHLYGKSRRLARCSNFITGNRWPMDDNLCYTLAIHWPCFLIKFGVYGHFGVYGLGQGCIFMYTFAFLAKMRPFVEAGKHVL